ncbi:hypothetical protein BDR04DRAFT_1164153 [Suillus decipiens]|nr:hypothetical protein BDR04DRAFT_1164153 [Suillus decipiens]
MEVDCLTHTKKVDLMKKGKCFNCKQPRHCANNCPKKREKSTPVCQTETEASGSGLKIEEVETVRRETTPHRPVSPIPKLEKRQNKWELSPRPPPTPTEQQPPEQQREHVRKADEPPGNEQTDKKTLSSLPLLFFRIPDQNCMTHNQKLQSGWRGGGGGNLQLAPAPLLWPPGSKLHDLCPNIPFWVP